MPNMAPPTVLSIAGLDPSAGAGVLADIQTFAALGVTGMACVTALTVQSTQGVRRVEAVRAGTVFETLDCLAEDVSFSAIKVGMLGCHSVAIAVVEWLEHHPGPPVVLDPVFKSSSGKDLLDVQGLECLRERWLVRANWVTPNLSELSVLANTPLPVTVVQIEDAARKLHWMATQKGNPGLRIVVTGGHFDTPDDLLVTRDICHWFPGERIQTTSTHGTGCAFSSALTALIALGHNDLASAAAAKEYVAGALRHAYPVGRGAGPLNHFWR